MVALAGHTEVEEEARTKALEELCRDYWYPLYAFVRRIGNTPHDSQDIIQGYFLRLLAKNFLKTADESRGRFRTFLLTSLRHYMADEWRRGQARKRGGGMEGMPLNTAEAEPRYGLEMADHLTADKIFERRWADTMLRLALDRLREAYREEGREAHFSALKTYLIDDKGTASYEDTAERLGLSLSAVKSAIHRLRQRYGKAIRAEILETVSNPGEVEDELRHLFEVLSS